jgi:hypothetical protein
MEQVLLEKGESAVYGEFANIFKPQSKWTLGGYKLEDGTVWQYREPDATVTVQNGRLKVRAVPFTRFHHSIQTLDNAKHMYFSREHFQVPEEGATAFDVDMKAIVNNGKNADLYDAFAAFNLLDFSTGLAFDWFVGADQCATVYARVHFPGTSNGDNGMAKYFAIFNEMELPEPREELHHFRIRYSRVDDTVAWFLDDHEVNREEGIPTKVEGFTVALGLMTNRDLRSTGSASLHGQGATGEWSPLRVTRIHGGQ